MTENKLKLEDLISGSGVFGEKENGASSAEVDQERIELVGIIGGGVMGTGIARAVAASNIDVILVEIDEQALDASLKRLSESMDREIQRWGMTSSEKKAILQKIKGTFNINDIKDCDIIIEAVDEDLTIKKNLFKQLDKICPPTTIFVSNTSTLSLTALSQVTSRPDKFIGLHFLNPVPKVLLVEVIRGMYTSDETTQKIKNFAKKIGKTPVEVFEFPGFITTRVIIPYLNEAMHVLMEGLASPEGIDTAMKLGYNFPFGPLELADTIGLDEVYTWMNSIWRELGEPRYRPCPLLRKMVREGKLGKKTGEGFFKYDKQGRKKQ